MADCMYIVTQDELDDLRFRLEGYKTILNFRYAIKEAVDALSMAFAQIAVSVEEVLKSFYKPKSKPKRPQRKILSQYNLMLDQRKQVYKMKTWRMRHDHR